MIARRLGVNFFGTSKFRLPASATLRGRNLDLSFPNDPLIAFDLIDVWLDDDYGLNTVASPVRSVLDIGANVGLFSLWAWRHFPNARIHAYEPNPSLQCHLKANLCSLPNVTIWNEGLADKPGRARLQPSDSSLGVRTKADETGEIPMTDLTTAIARLGGHVDLLKLDCEGAEWAIFRDFGAFQHVQELRMEYHNGEGGNLDDLRAIADRLGFKITYLQENEGFGLAYLSNSRISAHVARR